MSGDAEVFEAHRRLLFSVAYRILGSAADAEDAVQDSWLRWSAADRSAVADPKAYLVRIVTNLALDRLRSAQHRRESYVGPWLPEPVLTSTDEAADPESVSLALLVVLETLSPLERAVFVLREAFGFGYGEIADAVQRSEATVRQAALRARRNVRERRPRFRPDRASRQAVTERFVAAATGGDLGTLLHLLAPDVTVWTDGGGRVPQLIRPLTGADRVAAMFASLGGRSYQGIAVTDMVLDLVEVNGGPGIVFRGGGRVIGAFTLDLDEQGRIAAIHNVANPDKLAALAAGTVYRLDPPTE
ncbi:RNA polymerase sigma-70 factor [Actinocatenispora comari]|jgi:RNA polymerase sigma-70 factor (ECF subfamily)|uniref:RNA polymerase sigma24 factor n=1 Tax=Actinocatenispora comari TaxID=2807577 RepID=A0A8J4EN12_9ACTN|nr:RNA polymerase sigma-70 factor [Actinocatenispora comari]GIL29800.1 RNA polymerase sigma24 factor [Actinocatenispora comari]